MTSSTTTSSFLVQSVPSRRKLRERLLAQLPGAIVVEDAGPPPGNPWRGYQLCLKRALEEGTDHAVVIQDDTLVCRDFPLAVDLVRDMHPDVPVCLFFPGSRSFRTTRLAQRERRRGVFIPMLRSDYMPVVAVLWPRGKIESFLSWSQEAKLPGLPNPRSDDAVCGTWVRMTHQTVLLTLPSLVQHPDDTPPVKDGPHKAGHGRDAGRVAYEFSEDPLRIEWTQAPSRAGSRAPRRSARA